MSANPGEVSVAEEIADTSATRPPPYHPMFVWGEPDAGDFRCGVCGSFLYSVVHDGEWVHVTLGSLVDTPSLLPDHHIFVGSKAPWDEIGDGLRQFERYAT